MPITIAIRRAVYRVAFRVMQLYWLLARPATPGVKAVITDGDRLLLVRHTYGSRAWDLPGGGVHRNETPASAVRREMEEELGLGNARWRPLGEIRGRVCHRRDTVSIFGAEVSDPELSIDFGELAAAAWFTRDRLPLWTGAYLRPILAGLQAHGVESG